MMVKRSLLLFFIFSFLFAGFQGEDEVWKGINAFYNYETDKAIEILEQAKKDYPEHPAVHMTWVAARYLHNQANHTIEETYNVLEKDLESVIIVYEALDEKYPDIPEYQLFLGSAIGFKARVYLGRKEWIKTLVTAFQGYKLINHLETKHPEIIDDDLPVGLVEYFASLSGPIVQFATNVLGFSSDKNDGLAKIQKAADHGPYAWIESSSILSFLALWVENDLQTAMKYSTKLVEKFPGNFYFRIMKLQSMIKTDPAKDYTSEIVELRKILGTLTDTQKSWYTSFLQYEEALIAYHNGNHQKSLELLDLAISEYNAELDMVLGECYYLTGQNLDKLGKNELAQKAYKKCADLKNYTYVVKQANIALGKDD